MIVVVTGDHVAADAGLTQRRGEGGGQANGLQCRVHVEGDPGGHIVETQAGLLRVGALQDHRQAFLFAKAADDVETVGQLAVA
ncbi:hypothetical protein D3C73_1208040 [compost metagenome]